MTCGHFGRDQICTQVKASFSPFGHPTQVNASWVTSINLLLANEIEDSLRLKMFFFAACKETCESVWPTNASLYASSTYLRLRLLAGPFGQGFIHGITIYPVDSIKPWPNGLASRRKLKTWVYLRLRLTRALSSLRATDPAQPIRSRRRRAASYNL